jgi:hypothetical protein
VVMLLNHTLLTFLEKACPHVIYFMAAHATFLSLRFFHSSHPSSINNKEQLLILGSTIYINVPRLCIYIHILEIIHRLHIS